MEVNTGLVGEEFSSRFQVLERPTVYPGQCACCGTVDRPVVDFGVEIDFERQGYGALLLCEFCVKQAASKFPQPVESIDYGHSFEVWKKEYVADVKRRLCGALANIDLDNIPVYGSPDSVPEQAESVHVTVIESELQRKPESPSGSVVEADDTTSDEGPASVSGSRSDESEDDPLGFLRGL